jgi:AcrR family transcriptional regulator
MSASTRTPAREKILDAAAAIFYERGYQATTVDQVIERSGVSRPTLYTHFTTKEDLGVACLQQRRQSDLAAIKDAIRREKTAKARVLAVIKHVGETLVSTNYRGCGFFNMIAEFPDANNPMVQEARRYIDGFRDIIRDLVVELKASSPKYKTLDVNRVAETYYLLLGGAIMGSQEYQQPWPITRAIKEIEQLVEK